MSDLDQYSYDAPAEPTEAECKLDPEQGAVSLYRDDNGEQPEMDMLHAWVLRDPSNRTVARMARLDGNCIVELKGLRGEYRSETQLTFASAIRTVLMIAAMEGDK